MKKFLLSVGAMLIAVLSSAQIIFYVEPPSTNEGNYDFTYAVPGAQWGVPDLTNPASAVTGDMCFSETGTAGDSLACDPVTNNLTGKVAVCYRGSCEFGVKALNCQNAGAIAVIIINNAPGAPLAMGGGAQGINVTIPVIMISAADGALLRSEILGCNTSVFIGSKNGLYADDLGMTDADLLRAKSFSNLQLLSQNATEFEVEVGTWVRNYGSNDQTGILLNCMVDLNSVNLYNETSAPFDLLAGDSAFISLPTFSQASYANGYYEMTYSVSMTPLDLSTYDNVREADFMINDSLWSYAKLNPTTYEPVTDMLQFNGTTTSLETCIHFQDANASRVAINGINFSGGTSQNPTPSSLDGEYIEIFVYEWTDVFTVIDLGAGTPDLNAVNLDEITTAEYNYITNLQSENIYVPFDEPIALEDNARYLFCITTYSPAFYPGYESSLDYNWNFETYLQPINMLRTDAGQWFPAGYGTDQSPAMSINFMDAATIGLVELPKSDIVPFPNPANESINLPLKDACGNVVVTIVDLNGRVVSNQNITTTTSMLTLDVTTLPTGMYTVKLAFEDGTSKDVQVVVNR
ncbi:MAG: T9SS type A sorting domain-containing protein [Crocinitomicaceae bacterium]|jgi:hypothetical protein|nr:T9SS type A sorting domain-containing protein [Crocinitomicaceae bacterium]MBK6951185.1 T9SS type A sorting domain-containing protein [Crocinitomicaceae bacterium]